MFNDSRRAQLYGLLGRLPDRDRPVTCRKLKEEVRDGYILETLVLDLNGIEPVPAYFVKPLNAEGKMPVILYNHAHGAKYEIGKEELLAGRPALHKVPYAVELTRLGYAALCFDAWAFGERRGRTESELFKHMLWHGRVMWGMMVYDSLKAVDYLTERPDIDAERIGTLGLSMGSTMAWWLAALDERVKVCVDICCLTDFHALIEAQGLDGHGIYYYVPDLLNHFTASDIHALIAPRPHLSLVGRYDRLTPPSGVNRIDEAMRRVYAEAGAPDAWKLRVYETGHFETAEMRETIVAFLRDQL